MKFSGFPIANMLAPRVCGILVVLGFVGLFAGCKTPQEVASVQHSNPPPSGVEKLSFQKCEAMNDNNFMKNWEKIMPQEGTIAPDFIIFSQDGEPFNLQAQLHHDRHILLVSGSYTCDLSRKAEPMVQKLFDQYNDKIDINIVYTVEAHPFDTVSPYSRSNNIWVVQDNVKQGIEAKNPTTYEARLELAKQWKDRAKISPRMLIDNPENEFWTKYGQAPNMVFLIRKDGVIHTRQIKFEGKALEERITLLLQEQ